MIRRIALDGSPSDRGRAHGAAFRDELRAYTADRIGLSAAGTWSDHSVSVDAVLSLAEEMLPAHAAYAPDLYEEMAALADAGGISLAEAVVVGGFTDFVDAARTRFGSAPDENNCTAVLVPPVAAVDSLGLFGQTWDMHDSAAAYVVLLEMAADHEPASLVFTTLGCVGQIGMNEAGICVGINNLTAAVGRVGATWPFVVRKALQQSELDSAVKCVLEANLAGAHNYLLMDGEGRAVNIEALPQATHVTEVTDTVFVHTNHVLAPDLVVHEAVRPSELVASSMARWERSSELLAGRPIGPFDLMDLTREPTAVCQVATAPHRIESCGAAVMRPGTGDFWAVAGRPDQHDFEHTSPA